MLLVLALVIGLVAGYHLPPRANSAASAARSKAATHAAPAAKTAAKHAKNGDGAADETLDPIASYEDLIYDQPNLIDASVKQLRAQVPGHVDLYALGFAGDYEQPPFRNEVDLLQRVMTNRFNAAGRTLELINSDDTFKRTPLATRTNLYQALDGIARTMDRDEDVLLLFLTSHGSEDHQLYVAMGAMPLDQLTPEDIRDALDTAKIRWRIVVVSACYSGGFIPALREPNTLVITAARTDRTSFGCGADSKLTYFGRAFLQQALNQTTDFHSAFDLARKSIAAWEKRDGEVPSEPQYWEGAEMREKLSELQKSLPIASTPNASQFAGRRSASSR